MEKAEKKDSIGKYTVEIDCKEKVEKVQTLSQTLR